MILRPTVSTVKASSRVQVYRCGRRIDNQSIVVPFRGARRASYPLPLRERVVSSVSEKPGEGSCLIEKKVPLTRLASHDARHPLPQGERVTEFHSGFFQTLRQVSRTRHDTRGD